LFGVKASVVFRKGENTVSVTASSINLIAFLEKNGLRRGNKVSNQVAIPSWITANRLYSIACLRGLMDTDGSFYAYTNIVNAKPYHNFALCFTNRSKPLIEGVFGVLSKLGLSPYLGRDRVYLYKKAQVLNYLKIIGSHNPKHLNSYKAHVNSR
jgi:intein/homing endonuclease